MAKDNSWMDKVKGGSRTSSYTEKKKPKKKKGKPSAYNLLGGVSAEAARNMKDAEIKKKSY